MRGEFEQAIMECCRAEYMRCPRKQRRFQVPEVWAPDACNNPSEAEQAWVNDESVHTQDGGNL
jgi:hypothetical protein